MLKAGKSLPFCADDGSALRLGAAGIVRAKTEIQT
jgi:hypothetical protein